MSCLAALLDAHRGCWLRIGVVDRRQQTRPQHETKFVACTVVVLEGVNDKTRKYRRVERVMPGLAGDDMVSAELPVMMEEWRR